MSQDLKSDLAKTPQASHAEKFCIGRPQEHCFFDSEHKFLIIPMPNLGNILQTFKTGEAIKNKV